MILKKMLSCITILSIGIGMLASCSSNDNPANEDTPSLKAGADLVVYGKIFTSDNNKVVEAFAVKDGKYIYVGDKAGAEAYVEAGKTEVVDYTGKGLVMPGCGNGHAHYSMAYALRVAGTMIGGDVDPDKFLKEIVPAAVKKAKDNGATSIFGFGWRLTNFQDNMPTRQQLDAICNDIPMYFSDEEGHKGLANTLCLVKAGIMKEDGTVLKKDKDILGGEIVMDADGTPTGFLKEQAGTYTRYHLDNENLFSCQKSSSSYCQRATQCISTAGVTIYLTPISTRAPSNWTRLGACTSCWA